MNEKRALVIAMIVVMKQAEEWLRKIYKTKVNGKDPKREREKYQELIQVYVILERLSRAKLF